jgi:hypothetical protein
MWLWPVLVLPETCNQLAEEAGVGEGIGTTSKVKANSNQHNI